MSKSLIFIIDVLRSNDFNMYQQVREYLEAQEPSILKTNAEISKDLVFYEKELEQSLKTKEKLEENGEISLRESDFAKLEKYEILKKLNESLKLELAQIKEKFGFSQGNSQNFNEFQEFGKKNSHVKRDSLEIQLEECVFFFNF